MNRTIILSALAMALSCGTALAQAPKTPAHPTPAATTSGAPSAPKYSTEAAAKTACGSDPVVWANSSSKVLHPSGDRYYGKTKQGSYMCQSAAVQAGYHMTKEKS